MRLKTFLLFSVSVAFLAISCNNAFKNVSPDIAIKAQEAIKSTTPERQEALTNILKALPTEQREALAYLYAYMPQHDLDTLSPSLIQENIEYAYKAYNAYPWVKTLPKEIFYNEVVPHIVVDETRDSWRPMFMEMFGPLAASSADMRQAIDTINKVIKDKVNVTYNTKRKKPNQSPSESMAINMASCTGLSILLIDAFRSVGIPARFAGTPMWVSREGNHNWVEVWVDGEWYITEYTPESLNHAWFMPRAGKADKNDPVTWIYASSYAPTGTNYPMVWARKDTTVHGIDVTDRYINLYNSQQQEAGKGSPISIKMYKSQTGGRASADRVASDVKVYNLNNDLVIEGKTASATQDMNDYLTLYVPVNGIYEVEYQSKAGVVRKRVTIDGTTEVEIFEE